MNTVSEIEGYYKKREQRLLKKLHQQEVALDAANQKLAQLIRNQTAQLDEATEQRAAQDQKLKEELYKDPLTGAYNRRYYEEVVRKSIGPAGIALMDVDDFKICNDTYGHYAGDVALKTVASAIQSCIRSSDLLIRYGGDEFLLVLPGIPGDFLQTKLEQICTAAQMASVPGYPHFRVSLSIGGTIQSITDPVERIVRRADWLMYQAKGRKNAVMVEVPGHSLAALEKLLQNKSQILLVDDSAMSRMILKEILGGDYSILEAENGQECLEKMQAEAGNIALVLLDINMPVMDGFEVLKAMNVNHTIEDIPVIMISSDDSDAAIRRSYELGASDYVTRPFDARIVYRRVTNTIKLYAKQRRLVQMVSDQIRARENNTDMLVGVLSHIVEFRNGESGAHVRHIRIITELLLHRLLEISSQYPITAEQQDNIPLASALHDIGKIGIDEKILNKPGRLTPEEFEVVKTHSMLGAEMLHQLEDFNEQPLLQTAYEITRWHHERWDGRGYPDGLKGDEIPISAQLVALADVYDALTSERCYKKAFSHEKAVQMILNGECGAFNPLLLQCLTDVQTDLKVQLQQRTQ
ncbi:MULTISPECIES: diguanylate cyclase [Faecalibacterium]|uniref:diguanylate cyclase n=1 Tax=Faecalibacterium TaxID=216851 RepID=UPI000E4BF735|nr:MULTISPECIES: diguanylate cyclase [Faecalibacterium]RHQ29532.1 diguanylate cyclase [Faecalibacterium sp. AF28-13AC]